MSELDPWTMPLGGTALIEASAGTGKTYTLTTLYLRLLVEHDLRPAEILVVTYTQAATAELRERVRARIREAIAAAEQAPAEAERSPAEAERPPAEAKRSRARAERPPAAEGPGAAEVEPDPLRALGLRARALGRGGGRPDPLRRALREFDEAAIFTIHGFCQRTLQENAFESGLAFDAELVESAEPLERALAHDLWTRLLADESPGLVAWLLEGGGRKRWQFEPEALQRDLLGVLGADERMPVVPEPPKDEGDLGGLEAAAAGALRAWAAAWTRDREALAALLGPDSGLKQTQYKAATIASRWLPELDALARAVEAAPDDASVSAQALPDVFPKLTPEALVAGAKKGATPIAHPGFEPFAEVEAAVAALEAARETRALSLRHRFVVAAREETRRRREERHRLRFDDLLSALRDALEAPGGERLRALLRERYRFALIDEFQDTDPVQYAIFRGVWHEERAGFAEEGAAGDAARVRGMVLIGDPKQAIYSFRDADVFTYLAARRDAHDRRYGLETNWRSDPGLIAAVNALFSGPPDAFRLEGIDFAPVRPRPGLEAGGASAARASGGLHVLLVDRAEAAAAAPPDAGEIDPEKPLPLRFGRTTLMEAIARDVADRLDAGAAGLDASGEPLAPSDFAILCRRKAELQRMRRALEEQGIPCVDRGEENVFETREAWELVSVLRAMMRSGDPATLRGALSTGAHGLDAPALAALDAEGAELAAISERYAEYGRVWSQSGFGRAFERWRREEGVTARLLAWRDGERRLTNWLHLAELLQRRASEHAPSRAGLLAWLERAIASADERESLGADASLLRLERDDQAVSLVTLHRSKGLEYPVVYLPCLWEGVAGRGPTPDGVRKAGSQQPPIRFHDPETGRRSIDLAGHADYPEHVARQREEAFAEQIRLLYVGLTRARHECVVAWGAIGTGFPETPLAWLLQGEDPERDRARLAKAAKGFGDADWWAAWERVAARAGAGAISLERPDYRPRARWQAPTAATPELVCAPPTRVLGPARRTTSFSALLREGHRLAPPLAGLEETGRDLDAGLEPDAGGGTEPAARPPATDTGDDPLADLAAGMHAFPRGAEAGTLLHEVLETVDPGAWAVARGLAVDASTSAPEGLVERVREQAARQLEALGLDAAHLEQVLHVLDAVAATPIRLAPEPFALGRVAPGQLLPEMEFTLATPGGERCFDPEGLAALLATAGADSPLGRYAERAGRLGFPPLRGFLRGFVDAVFHDGERYFLIDYKSNHLGVRQRDYLPDALVAPMVEHDYVLQSLIYAIALDRHLATRLADYDYDRHFGGVHYLFLRGLAPSHAPLCGVFFDRPEQRLVREAGRLMGLPEAPGAPRRAAAVAGEGGA